MDLILWRHAHAGERWEDPQADLSRPLSIKGERQAARMAEWLARHLTESTRVIVSPATRAQQTAAALGRPVKTLAALAPGASAEDVLAAARYPRSREAVLVVGHQPTLGQVAARLLNLADPEASVPIRKGAVWWWRTRDREDQVQVVLHTVIGPDQV